MDRSILITGGTKGIGLATANKFLSCGDKVVVLGRRAEPENLAALQALGDAKFIQADVSSAEDCARAVRETMRMRGGIDVLCNVAGVVGTPAPFMDADLADIQKTVDINLMGTIAVSQLAAREMARAKRGVIVNVSSICGFMANTESIGYHASKGGVSMLTKAMARELSPYGIRVVAVAPGWVQTGRIDDASIPIGGKLHLKGRIMNPAEIADAIYLLSLPEAGAINGTTVMTDDGYTAFKGVDSFTV